jgi:hypothetical protein
MHESPRDWLQGYLFFRCPDKESLLKAAERIVPLADVGDLHSLFGTELAASASKDGAKTSDVYAALLEHLGAMERRSEVWARLSALAYRLDDPAIEAAYAAEMEVGGPPYPW